MMKASVLLRSVIGTLVLLLLLVACAQDQDGQSAEEPAPDDDTASEEDGDDSEPEEPAELLEVDVVAVEGNQLFPLRVMEAEGLDEEHGVKMNLQTLAGPQALLPALQSPDLNVSFGPWTLAPNMREGGVPLTNVYSASLWLNDVVVAEDSGIESLADLRGRNVGIYGGEANPSTIFFRYLVMSLEGFDPLEDATVQFGAGGLLAGQLTEGQLDAAFLPDPQVSELLARGDGFRSAASSLELFSEVLPVEPVWVTMIANEEWAEANPEAMTGFIAAYSDALEYLTENEDPWPELAASVNVETDEGVALLRERIISQFLNRWEEDMIDDMSVLLEDIHATLGEVGGLPATTEGAFTADYVP